MSKNSINIDKIKKRVEFQLSFPLKLLFMGVSYMFGSFIFLAPFLAPLNNIFIKKYKEL